MSVQIINDDCIRAMQKLKADGVRVNCCVTSPPYFGLRDYGHKGQIGNEPTPKEFVEAMVTVFCGVRDILTDDGVLWLNLGDSYAGSGRGARNASDEVKDAAGLKETYRPNRVSPSQRESATTRGAGDDRCFGFKPKDLMLIPSRVAIALQDDGWYLRAACPWLKRNGMPDSTTSRPTQCIETLFMLTKSRDCFYDAEAVKKVAAGAGRKRSDRFGGNKHDGDTTMHSNGSVFAGADKRLRRTSDWFFESWQGMLQDEDGEPKAFVVNTKGYKGAHFATFPPSLIEPCVLSSCPVGGTVLDPFGGSGTTGEVAQKHGRNAVLIELNPDYIPLIEQRLNISQEATA